MADRVMQYIIFADSTAWKSMGSGFRGSHARFDSGDIMMVLLIVTGVGLGAFLLWWLLLYQDRGPAYHNPWALFRGLCKAHQLDRSSRQLLQQVARWQRLSHPARIFLEPSRYEAANLSPELQERLPALTELRDKIFATEDA